MRHYCNYCRATTETVNFTDCDVCGLSKSNDNLDEQLDDDNLTFEESCGFDPNDDNDDY